MCGRSILDGEEFLFYPSRPIDVAFLRGTTADAAGNVTMEREAATLDSLSLAQATKSSGGIVIVQVERVTARHVLPPRDVRIPGIFVDGVVVAREGAHHVQTFAESYNPAYVGEASAERDPAAPSPLDARRVIARRATKLLKRNSVVNIGIGIPEGIVGVAVEEGILHEITLTVEAGPIGGVPASGLSFGAAANPCRRSSTSPTSSTFTTRGWIRRFSAWPRSTASGNVNVSRFARRLAGAGGFIDISQAARSVVFMGTFTTGADVTVENGQLRIRRDSAVVRVRRRGRARHFQRRKGAGHGPIGPATSRSDACLRLGPAGLELIEIAPGVNLERDLLAKMGFRPQIALTLRDDPAIFCHAPIGLARRSPLTLQTRTEHRPEGDLVLLTLDGFVVDTIGEADPLNRALNQRLRMIPCGRDVIVDCDGFELGLPTAPGFLQLLCEHEQSHSGSWTWYCAEPLLRRELRRAFLDAQRSDPIHPSFRQAVDALGRTRAATRPQSADRAGA